VPGQEPGTNDGRRFCDGGPLEKTHGSDVLLKLGARDRTQAVIAAYESGFMTA
jgi:hypothetical protein